MARKALVVSSVASPAFVPGDPPDHPAPRWVIIARTALVNDEGLPGEFQESNVDVFPTDSAKDIALRLEDRAMAITGVDRKDVILVWGT
jgi:hypothetical protein